MCKAQLVFEARIWWGVSMTIFLAASGCHRSSERRTPPPPGDTIIAVSGAPTGPRTTTGGGDATATHPAGDASTPQAAVLAAVAARLPAGWSGTGVLARRTQKLPRHAPRWARIEAEVIDTAGKRYLVTSGLARGIRNRPLAQQTAEARARAHLAQWLGTEHLVFSEITATWSTHRGTVTLARARIAVPADWQPGHALPSTP